MKEHKFSEEEFDRWLSEMWVGREAVRHSNIVTYKTVDEFKQILENGKFLPIENAIWSLMELEKLITDSSPQSVKKQSQEFINKIFERLAYFLEIQNNKGGK